MLDVGLDMLLRADGISKSFGPNHVLKDIMFQVNRGDRIALVGANGSGKSTLLSLLTKDLRPDSGELIIRTDRVGYLPQIPTFTGEEKVLETVKEGIVPHLLNERVGELESMMTSGMPGDGLSWDDVAEEYGRLRSELNKLKGDFNERDLEVLQYMGIEENMLNKRIGELSGGEVTKVMLAKILMRAEDYELLILDEPTSHLDIDSVEWLEDFLLDLDCAQVIVSHDRYFLDDVVIRVVELERENLRSYTGNYSTFAEKKALDLERQWKEAEKDRVKRERHERVAEELHKREWFSDTHKTRQKMIDRMDWTERPYKDREIVMEIGVKGKSGRNMVLASDLEIRRGRKEVITGLDLSLETGNKMGIFGPNGAGKTTLIKGILGKLPYRGELWVAPGARIGYFAQGHDMLDNTKSAEQQIVPMLGEDEGKLSVRRLLAKLLLTGEQVERPIGSLSGGERARVALAMLIADQRNLLVMDEPTNYLDIPAKHAVESALADYPGTLLIVTHDRYLMDAVCNKVGVLRNGKLDVHVGNYSDLKGRPSGKTKVEEARLYRVISPFTEWGSRKKYSPGDKISIADGEMEKFKWAIETGKLKRIPGTEMKRVDA